jgi:hypothetical protein
LLTRFSARDALFSAVLSNADADGKRMRAIDALPQKSPVWPARFRL